MGMLMCNMIYLTPRLSHAALSHRPKQFAALHVECWRVCPPRRNSLTTLPMGGGKGGADFDPKG